MSVAALPDGKMEVTMVCGRIDRRKSGSYYGSVAALTDEMVAVTMGLWQH